MNRESQADTSLIFYLDKNLSLSKQVLMMKEREEAFKHTIKRVINEREIPTTATTAIFGS